MVSINSISASLYISQATISISTVNGANKSDDANSQVTSAPEHSHDHRQRGTGFFMQSVMHALVGLRLNVPRNTGGDDNGSSDHSSDQADTKSADLGRLLTTFMRDLHQILARAGTSPLETGSSADGEAESARQAAQAPANAVAAGSIGATGVDAEGQLQVKSAATPNSPSPVVADNSAPQAAAANFGEALHSYLHELRRALQQSSDWASDENGRKDRQNWGGTAGWQGYRHFSANVDKLMADLTSADQTVSGKYKSLTEGFNRVVDLIGGSNTSGKPSLLAFLTKLKDEVAIHNPVSADAGAIVSTSV